MQRIIIQEDLSEIRATKYCGIINKMYNMPCRAKVVLKRGGFHAVSLVFINRKTERMSKEAIARAIHVCQQD